jgi:hypothetical protein
VEKPFPRGALAPKLCSLQYLVADASMLFAPFPIPRWRGALY